MESFLKNLSDLVSLRSPYTEPQSVRKLKNFCKEYLQARLLGHQVWEDSAQNVVAISNNIDPSLPILYLSAHLDTVPAKAQDWNPPFDPYIPYRDAEQIVGRGVNDCKAGIAFQFFIADEIAGSRLDGKNICFLLSFKEEGPGEKSAQKLGQVLGAELPLNDSNSVLVLENTVSVFPSASLGIYTAERSSYAIKLEGTLNSLKNALEGLTDWNPVSIEPIDCEMESVKTFRQPGGHICTRTREENLLFSLIMNASPHGMLRTNEGANNFSVVPTEIHSGQADFEIRHALVLTLRALVDPAKVLQSLTGHSVVEVKPFQMSHGLSQQEGIAKNPLTCALLSNASGLEAKIEVNTGSSDASIMASTIAPGFRNRLHFLVAGPGCRSHRTAQPPRLTHGVNETFFVGPGLSAVRHIYRATQEYLSD